MIAKERLREARAWLFDLDGTLVEQRVDFGLMRRRVLELVSEFGLDVETGSNLRVLELVEHVQHLVQANSEARSKAFRTAADAAIESVELMAVSSAQVLEGVPELLELLEEQRLPVAVVTRNCHAAAVQILEANDLACDLLVAREDTPFVKPSPEHLQIALDAFGVAGSESVMCGDYIMDILAGTAVGATTVAVAADGDFSRFAASSPDILVRTVGELGSWL